MQARAARFAAGRVSMHRVRLATWNVNSLPARMPRVLEWLARVQPEVLCLQETKVTAEAFPAAELERLGYAHVADGEGGRNGVAILSRVGLEGATRGFPGEPGAPITVEKAPAGTAPSLERRAIAATCAGVRVWSLYVPNGRSLDSPHFAYKLAWLAALRAAIEAELSACPQLALCGDFNVAPSDRDVWDPAAFIGSTHVTAEERAALEQLLQLGFTDVQPRALKGAPFTYWDYRAGMFHRGMGMRIDLVLLSHALAGGVGDAYIDRDARKGSKPSDHAPVVVDLDASV